LTDRASWLRLIEFTFLNADAAVKS
jgi:hypothetical protein